MSVPLKRYRFSVDKYHRLADIGILTEANRVELIDGEIIEMNHNGISHASHVDRIVNAASRRYAGRAAIVRVQTPVLLDDFSEARPDVSLLRLRDDFYGQAEPTPADFLLVVEVASTAVAYDRRVKVPLYARSEIPEVWIVDLMKDKVEIYARPSGGKYREVRMASRGELISLTALTSITFAAEEVLG